jgi:hypothetical protein
MRYRALDENGDSTFGKGALNFHVNNIDEIKQRVSTKLRLMRGEWFVDLQEGVPWQVGLGYAANTRIQSLLIEVKSAILSVDGVTSISKFDSQFDTATRKHKIIVELNTIYGTTTVEEKL